MGEFLQLIGFIAVVLINYGVMHKSISTLERDNEKLRQDIATLWTEMRSELRAIYGMLNLRK